MPLVETVLQTLWGLCACLMIVIWRHRQTQVKTLVLPQGLQSRREAGDMEVQFLKW